MRSLVNGIVALAVMLVGAGAAHAQASNYQPFRVDSGLAGSYVSASGRGGIGGTFEGKFNITDNIAVGGRVEAQVQFGGSFGADGDTKMSMGVSVATLAKGEYLVTTGAIRPFIGFGFGMYDLVSQSVEAGPMTAAVDQKAGRYFGIAPQIGIDLGRMRLAATYNMILGADVEIHQQVGGVDQSASYSQNYLTFEMSFRFGGRRITRPAPPPPASEPRPMPPPGPPTASN